MSSTAIRRADLGHLEQLGRGGFARVYLAPEFQLPDVPGQVVYKQYFDRVVDKAGPGLKTGLQAIVNYVDRFDRKAQDLIAKRTVWPLAVVVDDEDPNRAIGILMRLIPQEFFLTIQKLHGPQQEPAEAKYLFCPTEDARSMGIHEPNVPTRLSILINIAYAYGLLHKNDVVVGDISPRNILYSAEPGNPASVLLVDCDSLRVRGSSSPFGAQPHTPSWEPPEAVVAQRRLNSAQRSGTPLDEATRNRLQNKTKVQSKATDVYKYGLLVVRILEYGRQKSGHRNLDVARRHLGRAFGKPAVDVLEATFALEPKDRPSMKDWYQAMKGRPSTPPPSPSGARTTLRPPAMAPERPQQPAPTAPTPRAPRVSGSWREVPGKGWERVVE